MHKIFLLFTAALFLLPPSIVTGADNLDSKAPIHVEADRMVSKQQENAIIFTGDVEAKQGDLIIYSDEMTVHHETQSGDGKTGKEKTGSQQIKKLFAKGNVKIVQEGLVATGDQMEFFAEERKVLLTGNTKVWQDNNLVTGEKILLDLNTETTVIEPDKKGGGRVKAFFYPDEKK